MTSRIAVRYAETDQQGIAYHAHYLVWMEIGRTRFLEALGFPYPRLEADGILFSVVEVRCRYEGAARYGDEVEITTRCRELRSRMLTFAYDLCVGARRVAVGETTLIALDARRRPRRIPPAIVTALRRAGIEPERGARSGEAD